MNAAERNVFLHDVPLEAARARFADALAQAGVRTMRSRRSHSETRSIG